MKLYGVAEIAEALGTNGKTVSVWITRGKLPKPSGRMAMGPFWTPARIEPWIEAQKVDRPTREDA